MTASRILAILVMFTSLAASPRPARAGETIRVAAAISLKEAITDVAAAYEKHTGDKVELSFGSSGQILAQIKGGAPIDAFISASRPPRSRPTSTRIPTSFASLKR